MTHQNSKIAIEYLTSYINNLPPKIIIKDITNENSPVSLSRQAIMKHYFYKEFNNPNDEYDYTNRCKKMSVETATKLGYIYKRILSLFEYESSDAYIGHEQWFIRQVIASMQNLNNPDFKDFDLQKIYNINWD